MPKKARQPVTPSDSDAQPSYTLLERLFAYIAIGMIVVAVISYLTTLVVALVAGSEALEENLWPLVAWLGYFGLPIGFAFLIALLIMSYIRKSKQKSSQ